jgi:hypothetical protein
MKLREGPSVRIDARCTGCRYEHSESYAVQGDSGHNVYCTHPAIEGGRRYVADTSWRTPDWCPLLAEAIGRTLESAAPRGATQEGEG